MLKNYENYKPSYYNIHASIPEYEDRWVLVNTLSGAIDVVEGSINTFLKKSKSISRKKIEEYSVLPSTLETLEKRGYITKKDEQEEKAALKQIGEIVHKVNAKGKTTVIFLVTYDCNFRCTYCYENNISNFGNNWLQSTFDFNKVDVVFKTIDKIDPNREKYSDRITLYGGEPLLYKNHKLIEYLVNEGSERGFNFEAVTNGYDLDKFSSLLGKDKLNSLQITIDGPPEEHDSRRIHYKDGGTFNKIINNIEKALAKDVSIKLRINTDAFNIQKIEKLLLFFENKNWLDNKSIFIYSALVDNSSETAGCHNTKLADPISSYGRIQYINDFLKLQKSNLNFSKIACQNNSIEKILRRSIFEKKLLKYDTIFCGAQKGMLIFDPLGDLYTCWELVGQKEYKVGDFLPELNFNENKMSYWQNRNIFSIDSCTACKYSMFCSGGCAGKALVKYKDYNSGFCDQFPKTFRIMAGKVAAEYLKQIQEKDLSS